jgi:hypothetical protein
MHIRKKTGVDPPSRNLNPKVLRQLQISRKRKSIFSRFKFNSIGFDFDFENSSCWFFEIRRLVAEEGSYPKKTWLSNIAEAW